MANSWLRLYHDMPNDPKWRTIAKASKQTIPVVLAVYVHLLTIASCAVDRGTLVNVNSEDLANALDVDTEDVDAVLAAMQGKVLEGEKLSGWDRRQYEREDGAAERARAWREKKKQEREAERKRTEANAANGSRTPDKNREEEIKKGQEPVIPAEDRAQRTAANPTAESIATRVQERTGIVTAQSLKFLAAVCRRELNTGVPPDAIVDAMGEAWMEYQKAIPSLSITPGAEKFFGEGLWKDRNAWPWKNGAAPPPKHGPPKENKALREMEERARKVREERGG